MYVEKVLFITRATVLAASENKTKNQQRNKGEKFSQKKVKQQIMLERSKSCKEKFSSWLPTSKPSSRASSSSSGSSQLTLERLIVLLSSAMECNCQDWQNVAKQVNDVRRSYSSSFDASSFKILTIQVACFLFFSLSSIRLNLLIKTIIGV